VSIMHLHTLDVGHGDAIIISLKSNVCARNILVDGGKGNIGMNAILEKLFELKRLDGIIVTHVDDDHIGGIINFIKYMNDVVKKEKPNFLENIHEFFVIFNKFDESVISYRQGNMLQNELEKFKRGIGLLKINCHLVNSYDISQEIILSGDISININCLKKRGQVHNIDKDVANITMLTPSKNSVIDLMKDWFKYNSKKKDGNAIIVNGTSISFLIEYGEKTLLMTGDAYIEEILEALNSLGKDKISKIDLVKLSHHGSYKNNDKLKELLDEYRCNKVFVSADGSYGLPDEKLIEELKSQIGNLEIACTNEITKVNYQILKKNEFKLQ